MSCRTATACTFVSMFSLHPVAGWALACTLALSASPVMAQDHAHQHGAVMPSNAAQGTPTTLTDGSGTSRLPANAEPMPGLHLNAGEWMLMAHGALSLQATDHSGPRGNDKVYTTSMAMLMASRKTDWGKVQLRSMLSFEPAMDRQEEPVAMADRAEPADSRGPGRQEAAAAG